MVSENLKNIRNFKSLSRKELAKLSGVNEVTIWKIETKRCDPSVSTLEKIAKAFGLEVSIFFADSINFSHHIQETA